MYHFDIDSSLRIGITITADDDLFNYFVLILDEANKLWYCDRKTNDIRANKIVCFRKGENYKALEVQVLPKTLAYIGERHKVFLTEEDEIGINGIIPNNEILNIEMDFDSVRTYHCGWYGQCGIIVSHYIKEDCNMWNRYFVYDEKAKTYREFSAAAASLYEDYLARFDNSLDKYPLDIEKASSIYRIVSNFNPVEVFESYRVEIDYYHQSRVGRDDYFYEYKKYSIKYHDEYLARWFKNEKVKLNFQSGYTSNFNPTVPYERFYKEENEAKSKAYAEYSRLEHFDTLMSSFYKAIQEHLREIENNSFIYPKTIRLQDDPDEMNTRKVYSWLYENISTPLKNYNFIKPKYNQSQKERYEEIVIEGLKRYNVEKMKLF